MLKGLDLTIDAWAGIVLIALATAVAATLGYALLIRLGYRLTRRRATAREFLQQCDRAGAVVVFLFALQAIWARGRSRPAVDWRAAPHDQPGPHLGADLGRAEGHHRDRRCDRAVESGRRGALSGRAQAGNPGAL